MTLLPLLVFVVAASTPAAQQPTKTHKPLVTCPGVARPALDLIVKNERGQVLRRTSWLDEWDHSWLKFSNDGHLYTVTIHRRWYKAQTVRNIKVQYDECGPAKPARVVVRLEPVPDAPRC